MAMAPLHFLILLLGVTRAAQGALAALRGSVSSTATMMEEPTVVELLEKECMVEDFEPAAVGCICAQCGHHPVDQVPACAAGMCMGELAEIPENCTSSALTCLSNYLPSDGPFTEELIVGTLTMCFNESSFLDGEYEHDEDEEEDTRECMEPALMEALGCVVKGCGGNSTSRLWSCVENCMEDFMTIPECRGHMDCIAGSIMPITANISQGLMYRALTMCFEEGPVTDDDDGEEGAGCMGAGVEDAFGCVATRCEGQNTSMLGNCIEKESCMDYFMMIPTECEGYVDCVRGSLPMYANVTRGLIYETLAMCSGDWPMYGDDDEQEPECVTSSLEPALRCLVMTCEGKSFSLVDDCVQNCSSQFMMIPPQCRGYVNCMGPSLPMAGIVSQSIIDETLAMCLAQGPMYGDYGEEPECMKESLEEAFGCVAMCHGLSISMVENCVDSCGSYFMMIPPECQGHVDCMSGSLPTEGAIGQNTVSEALAMCFEEAPMEDDDDAGGEDSDCMSAGYDAAFGCTFFECGNSNMSCMENCSSYYFNQSWAMCFGDGSMGDDDDIVQVPECWKDGFEAMFGCMVVGCSQDMSIFASCAENCGQVFNETMAMCYQDVPVEVEGERCMPEMVEPGLSCVLAKCSGYDSSMIEACMDWCGDEFNMLPKSCDPHGDCFHEFVYYQPYGTPLTEWLFMEAVETCFPCWHAGSHVMLVPGSRFSWETDSCAFLDKEICSGSTGWHEVVFENGYMQQFEFEDFQLCERANLSSSGKKELLFEAAGDSQMYDFYWPGWGNQGYFSSASDDGTPGVPLVSGKLPAYDGMCLAGLRFKDASGAFAEYELSQGFAGFSLVQIVQNCSMSTMFRRLVNSSAGVNSSSGPGYGIPGYGVPDMDMCSMVGKLTMSKDLPYVSEALQVHAYTATGAAMFSPVWSGSWAFGTSSANGAFAGTVSIEGVPALDLLFSAYGGSWDFNNQWPGWFQEGPYHIPSHGKLPAFDHKPLTMLRFADDKGRFAEYSLSAAYSGMSLLQIVQKCMPEDKRERRNSGGPQWQGGHCTDVGTLTASKGLEEVSQVLRIGVGDGTLEQHLRDWVVFMPVAGNGDGDFLRANTWAFGSKGETNTGNNDGPVYIYGGPSTDCVDKQEKCWSAGTRVMIVPGSRSWGDTYRCATLQQDVCEWDDDWTWVTFEDNYYSLYAYDDLQPCQALPGSTTFEELMFNASGWDWTFNNQFEGWFNWPEDGIPGSMATSMGNGVEVSSVPPMYESTGFRWDLYKTMCLNGVKFADKSGTFVTYKLGDDYVGKSLLQIVQECMHEEKVNRRNDGTRRWNEGHCLDVGYLQNFAGRDDFANLRIGVGDGKVGQLRDWTVFMPIHGNGNGDFLWPRGNSWSFGSKGRTNPAFEDEVYIYGYPDTVKLVGFDKCDLKNSWGGWYQSGSYGSDETYGKQLAYDQLPLEVLRFQDDDGNFAEYDLEHTEFEGKTLLEIVQYCMGVTPEERSQNWGYGWCEVGALRRFGGPALVSVPRSFRVGLAFFGGMLDDWELFVPQEGDWALFVPQEGYPTSEGFTAEDVWAFGTNCAAGAPSTPKMSIWGYSGMCDQAP